MKEKQQVFSPRARKLLGRAFNIGIDPEDVRAEAKQALETAILKGGTRATRRELKALGIRVKDKIAFNRLVN